MLLEIPDILEARVEPRADPEFGMRPLAYIYAKKPISLAMIHRILAEKLPRFKIPQELILSSDPLKNSKLAQMG